MTILIFLISLLLAVLMGFAAHRAGLCTVRSVAEILSTHKATILVMMLKTIIWVFTISVTIALLLPEWAAPNHCYPMNLVAITGGFLFGVGAAINGGCAFSTLGHLANGKLLMLMTLIGFCLGAMCMSILFPIQKSYQTQFSMLSMLPRPLLFISLAICWLFLFRETIRIFWIREKGSRWLPILLTTHYRLSATALVLGISGGMLYTFHESWTYTNALKVKAISFWQPIDQPLSIHLFLFLALFGGMALSAWQKGTIKLRWRFLNSWPRHLIGGTFMGAGATMIPGGNDTLLLESIPGMSPHAVPAFVALLCGIGVTLLIIRQFTGKIVKVICTNDKCQDEE